MELFNRDLLRSFAIGFVLGCVGLAMSMSGTPTSTGLVTPAVAATQQ